MKSLDMSEDHAGPQEAHGADLDLAFFFLQVHFNFYYTPQTCTLTRE